jgi:hypothetical protein
MEAPSRLEPHLVALLRHTFVSLLLQEGESPAYVERQHGHTSIQLTVDTYGTWLPWGTTPPSIVSTARVIAGW